MNNKKYYINKEGRCVALRGFGDVKKCDIGGFVESESNLSPDGDCWVYDSARVCDNARVYSNARICDNAIIYGNAEVYGDVEIIDCSEVYDNTIIYGNAIVSGNICVSGNAIIKSKISSNSDYVCIGQFGEFNRYITIQDNLSMIACGCFYDTVDRFKEEVKEKYGEDYGSYKNAVIMIDALINSNNNK